MKLLVVWIVALSILYATLSVVRHNHFQSGGFDLGIYDQAVWQYSKFIYPYNTVKDRFILGDHLTLTLPLLAPLFWLWDDVRALLVFQAVWVSVSVIAVYKLVRLRKFSQFTAAALAFIYSLFYGIQYGLFFDFHPVLLAVGLIPWMLYFLESKHNKLFIASLILLLATQENMGLAVTALGIIYFRRFPWLIPVGLVASFLSFKMINIFYPFQYMPQVSINPLDLFNAPEKQQVWLFTLASFSFLPILSPGALLAIAFDLAQYFMSGPHFTGMWSPFTHHRAILAPYVLLGTLDVLPLFKKHVKLVVSFLLVSTLLQQYLFHFPLNKLIKPEFWQTQQWEVDNQKMLASIPADVRITAQQSLVPHLSHRNEIYLYWPDGQPKGDYLLVDTHPNEWLTMLLDSPLQVNATLADLEQKGKLTEIRKIGDIRLFRISSSVRISYPESPR